MSSRPPLSTAAAAPRPGATGFWRLVSGSLVLLLTAAACTPLTSASTAAPALTPTVASAVAVAPTAVPTPLPSPTPLPLPPTASATPTATATLRPGETPSPTPLPSPTATIDPGSLVNGIPVGDIAVLPPEVVANLRLIFAQGQALGRNPYRFSKVGDSTSMKPVLLATWATPDYNLGPYAFLQPTIDHYGDSYARVGLAMREALHTGSVFDPFWANKTWCEPNEQMLECEFRYNNPSILVVRLGSNDAGSPTSFAHAVRAVLDYCIAQGVIPLLATKGDRAEGPDNSNNMVIRELAAEYSLPLWEFDRVAETLPGRGLGADGVHFDELVRPNDFSAAATFDSGYAMQDLTALLTLDAIVTALGMDGQ